ncbi:GNAT family N-acetyltransferase, partial [Congregibacter sp.]|uniref:GNAT family N-acetyltransferase n=1 Tax=Congregibacter sp. TaxID=2744308 RepID=UPI00385ADEB9
MSKKVEALKAIKQPELKTRRLVLRPFSMDDAEEINTLAGNFNVSKTTLNVPHPYSTEMAESWVATHKAGWEARTNVAYAITLSESGQLIGAIGLHN